MPWLMALRGRQLRRRCRLWWRLRVRGLQGQLLLGRWFGREIERKVALHALCASGLLLHGAELFEEFAPFDTAVFAALEAVGALVGGVGGC